MRNGYIDEVCAHMPDRYEHLKSKYTFEDIMIAAKKYQSRSKFYENDPSIYLAARRRGILEEVCSHMRRPNRLHTYESIKNAALKCKSRAEFREKHRNSYAAALRLKILDEICSHMAE